jgi:hypothetical protein
MYRSTAIRWIRILAAAFVAAIVFAYAGPLICSKSQSFEQAFFGNDALGIVALFIAAFTGITVVHRWIGSELGHARQMFRYPPLPMAVFMGLIIASCLPRFSDGLLSKSNPTNWSDNVLIAVVYALFWFVYAGARQFTKCSEFSDSAIAPLQQSAKSLSDAELKSWLKRDEPISDGTLDLFDHTIIARRLLDRLRREESTIALQGEFGSGKSSVCRIVAQEAKNNEINTIFVFVSCWGFEDATRAQKEVLEAILRDVSREVDCLSIRELPEAYSDAIGSHSTWARTLLQIGQRRLSPIAQLRRLSPILAAINRKVLVVIEDVDRTGIRFDITQIQALLMQFREVHGLSFILAISPIQQVDFVKLCDHLEMMPVMERGQILQLIHQTREMLLREFPAGIVLDKLQPLIAEDDDYTIFDQHLSYAWPWQIALCELLNQPRLLKHALRRVLDAWPRLHGEVNFDQLISIAALRVAAPEAFQFFCDRFHLFASAMKSDTSSLAASAKTNFKENLICEWKNVCAAGQFDINSVASLLKHIYPMTAAVTGISAVHAVVRQSMQSTRRRDVFARRLFTERPNPGEVRDQHILRLMQAAASDANALRKLAETITDSQSASDAFEDFADAVMFESELQLLTEVYAIIRERHGVRADRDACPGFFAPWRRITDNRPKGFEDWLAAELVKCIPGHLRLLTNIYYFWLGTNKHSREERTRARQAIIESVKTAWKAASPEAIAAGFDPTFPYVLFHLVFTSDFEQPDAVPFSKIEDWIWSGPILLKASQLHPEIILPHILIALNDDEKRGREIPKYAFQRDRLLKWFGDESGKLLSLIASGFAIHPEMPEQVKYLINLGKEAARAESANIQVDAKPAVQDDAKKT